MTTLTYKTLSDVPEGLRENAKEGENGVFSIKVAPADKIAEFRENNVKVVKERDELVGVLAQYEQVTGVTSDDLNEGKLSDFAKVLTTLRETEKQVKDGQLIASTSLEEAAQARVTEVTTSFKGQLADSAKERDAWKDRATAAERKADSMQVENTIRLAASDPDVAMLDKAVAYVLPQALQTFKVDEGKIVPKSTDGTILYGSDGVTPMTAKEWLLKQREDNDFLFQGSKGGGASGNSEKHAGRLSQTEIDAMSPQQRMNWARKNGVA